MADPTPYNFVTPIRYYKANDPYYYEVDNIPLRQLEENILYVKDKVEIHAAQTGYVKEGDEISIYNIKELRPKISSGRTIKVNAGRFVSRINDAFDMNKVLADLTRTTRPTLPDVIPGLSQSTWTEQRRNDVYNAFIGPKSADKSYNTNGLEVAYSFYSTPTTYGLGGNWGVDPHISSSRGYGRNYPWYSGVTYPANTLWPNIRGNYQKWMSGNPDLGVNFNLQDEYNSGNLPSIHLAFVQMWRGVFRTAVVDVPDSTIDIPAWSQIDYHYWPGHNVPSKPIAATQRIDLLVAYSLPIDASSTHIVDYQADIMNKASMGTWTPKKLTKPMLGLVMGAGVGIAKSEHAPHHHRGGRMPKGIEYISQGSQYSKRHGPRGMLAGQILACVSDTEDDANTGITSNDAKFSRIHGSFPSPDDLLNIAPVMALDVTGLDQLQLVGQAALPLAYIVVNKDQPEIVKENIIDIRPFLRTTEFTYNERAGVAAANPPLSFANPAVGLYQLQRVVDSIQEDIAGHTHAGATGPDPQAGGTAIYTDYIMGGLAFGVEGTLLTMCDHVNQGVNDPFGSLTTGQTAYVSPGNAQSYNFTSFSSSKNYMAESSKQKKQAFLEYIFNNRQGDLKRWLSNPNVTRDSTVGTYLDFPGGTSNTSHEGRCIPLWPEWDMPVDSKEVYNTMVGTSRNPGFRGNVNVPTYWMWMELQDMKRPMLYAPGGVVFSNSGRMRNGGDPYKNSTTVQFQTGMGWGHQGTQKSSSLLMDGQIYGCSKTLSVYFPNWVRSYDVLVEYMNCRPASLSKGMWSSTTTGGTIVPIPERIDLGTGLSISKGAISAQAAEIVISSWASVGQDGEAFIRDEQWGKQNPYASVPTLAGGQGDGDIASGKGVAADFQWMMYSVICPQYKQTKFGLRTQLQNTPARHRMLPKFGATFLPTVKFTIIGYATDPITLNKKYRSSGSDPQRLTMTYAPGVGDPKALTNGYVPWQKRTEIDIS